MERAGIVAIVGVGLIGGSVGQAVRLRALADRIIGVGRDPGRLEEARRLGAIDAGTTDLAQGVAEAEVVVIGTPVSRIARDVREVAEHARADALITDAGSTKQRIIAEIEADPHALGMFVGAHPIAGSERNGAAHARADLFEGRACVLTPTEQTPADRLARARTFWEGVGCRVTLMNPAEHDRALAWTSHLPHVVASALAGAIPADTLGLAAGAYRDGTRVAGADADLWTAIFLENRLPLIEALDGFEARLADFRRAILDHDADAIRRCWQSARERRGQFDALVSESPVAR